MTAHQELDDLEVSEVDTTSFSPTPPPLDQVTMCSDDDDSATSFSSLSDHEFLPETLTTPTETTRTARSIFRQYWAKNGGGEDLCFLTCAARPPPRTIVIVQQSSSAIEQQCHGNDETKSKQEAQRLQQQQQRRRSIFRRNCVSQSLPLGMAASEEAVAQTAAFSRNESTSQREKEQVTKRSCLQLQRRYSGTNTPLDTSASSSSSSPLCGSDHHSERSSERSVSFSPKIQVLVYQEPLERHAADGWSKYFAF
jgi:hypothetical protein